MGDEQAAEFDAAAFWKKLREHNPWAEPFFLNGTQPMEKDWSDEHGHAVNEEFRASRKTACLERLKAGAEVWNRWADAMLEAKAALEAAGLWRVKSQFTPARDRFVHLLQGETAESAAFVALCRGDFFGAEFNNLIELSQVRFPSLADFEAATFSQTADFESATFTQGADFRSATFTQGTDFEGATFTEGADFGGATFTQWADFQGATFTQGAVFRGATFTKRADFHGATLTQGAGFQGATFTEWADFEGATFTHGADFEGATFTEEAGFQGATFTEEAGFRGTTFTEGADFRAATFMKGAFFRDATFTGTVVFRDATFTQWADFQDATFTKEADFWDTTFKEWASFDHADFHGFTSFERARFDDLASFSGAQCKEGSALTLANSEFRVVPDFIQTDFQKAPRLDDVSVERGVKGTRGLEASARWRALKGLAIDAHDHERERDFFAGEILSLRHEVDKWAPWFWKKTKTVRNEKGEKEERVTYPLSWPGGDRYWFGVLYRGASNFGRSILRPLAWWLAVILLFAGLYLNQHIAVSSRDGGALQWLGASVALQDTDLACLAGEGHPEWQALQLSFSKAFVVGGLIDANASFRTQACLFEITKLEQNGLSSRVVPNTPLWVTALNALQVLISAVLIFLFLMAVRNQFRIR